ncbi:hypothetical protein D915_006750 [Fasciola hepatica]|uniref:Protein SMG9 n=1 Tax=Fasciola hepatica TaxID=6192 RepID=A0A4E0RPL6_FASHE|nr:hypothetical protein D915_006750 [Fasciola hepatica]
MKEDTVKRIFDLFNTPVNNPELVESESDIDQLYALCDDPMQCPVKLIDEQLRFTDLARIQDLFVENTGFLVVGAIGLQGCGKSSLLNVLANQLTNKTTPLDGPFRVQTIENFTTNSPQTGGIDLYITQDRVILLDVQPLMSFALTNYHVRAASSLSSSGQMDITPAASNNGTASSALSGPGNWSLDVWAEMTSLQIIAFLLNCCHVILVVSDEISNTPLQLHRLVDRASGLKPTMYTPAVIPQVFQRCQQSRVQTETATVTTECNQLAGRQGYASSTVDASKDPILTEGRVGTCMKAAGTTTGAYTANTSQTDEEEGETEDVDDADGGGSIDITPERHRTTHNASDEPNVTVAPSGLLQSHRTSTAIKRENAHQDVESTDVTAALNRLQSLTDYSASLIHVYNQAPSAAFLNPIVRSKLHAYQYQLLPMLYPETRRLAAMVTLGSRILSSHSIKTRYRNRSVEKTFATTVPTENQPRDTTSGVAEASSEASAFSETNHIVANQALGSKVVVDSDGGNKNDDIDNAHSEVPSGCSVSSVEPSASNHLLSDDHGQDERNMQVNRQDELGPQQTKLSNSSDVEEIAEANSAVNAGQKSKHEAQTGQCETGLLPVGGVTSGPTESDSPPIGTSSQSPVLFNLDKKPISVSQTTEKFPESSKQIPGPSAQQTNRRGITSGNLGDTRAPSEAELVAELDTVIHEVEHDVTELLKHPLSSLSTKHGQSDHSPIDSPHSSDASDSDPGASQVTDHLDGERLNARLARLTQQIQSVRRQFFDVQQRLNHPRLFLIPEVDSDGHPPTGCPSYASSVRVLQEAIMSTPRQHMMLQFTERKWIAYAQKMWEAVCSSPLLADYHAILTNRV